MTNTPVRREPPRFRTVEVLRVESQAPRLVRVTLGGPELAGFTVDEPAASVRLLLPAPGRDDVVVPTWNGNEFLLPDGTRPFIRTLTPARADPVAPELDVVIVLHERGVASEWAAHARAGTRAAVSGPGRGYTIDPQVPAFVIAGDETAIPAIRQLVARLGPGVRADVHIETAGPGTRLELARTHAVTVTWHDPVPGSEPGAALVAAIGTAPLPAGTRVWAAGEAAAMQRIRRHLFEERGLARAHATVRGYWKHGRAGDGE